MSSPNNSSADPTAVPSSSTSDSSSSTPSSAPRAKISVPITIVKKPTIRNVISSGPLPTVSVPDSSAKASESETPSAIASNVNTASESPKVEPSIYDGLVIPQNLQYLPTDTEAQRLKKKQKIKIIKQKWRSDIVTAQNDEKANNWRNFLSSKGNIGTKRSRLSDDS